MLHRAHVFSDTPPGLTATLNFDQAGVSNMKRQAGMTLFETMIVLAIVAFLMGAVISANQFVERATVKALLGEMDDVKHMLYAYREQFGRVPGDDGTAQNRFPNTVGSDWYVGSANNALIDGTTSSDWWGYHMDFPNSGLVQHEEALFWHHVRRAGLATGDPRYFGAFNAVKGVLGISSTKNMPTRPPGISAQYNVCSSTIPGKLARMMDAEVDDGDAESGMMWAAAETNNRPVKTATQATPYDNEKRYTVCTAF
ncbi:type II secretion system GspH family protein [Massilia oculi]|uniref:Type II secretion system GspH family protein n=1 Tax=Massilia hydrophila TaxID=3044279 RepID=A0ABS7YBN4_9BURK|nr:type II secretion system protein [Massilia oculi]MCA1857093.1 type II secretion system GspH family protein [Massilia oculi]